MEWETVIGLEIHAQLATKSKIFSGSSTAFGAEPNTQASLVDLGMPGVLPVLNAEVVRCAAMFGLATSSTVAKRSVFDRKNYFYPDLPKGYQISQLTLPIVHDGHLDIEFEGANGELETKRIGLTRAHLEEDAGKSLHEDFQGMTGVDLNRAGTPLLEIVSEPDIRSSKEAVAYTRKMHALVRYLGISDGNMQEGSFRCDVNVSVRPVGQEEFGTRAEIKNLNSFRFIEKAIHFEVERQIDLIEAGGEVVQETRLYDPDRDETRSMRSKEEANDYRYFPDPDLLPVEIDDAFVEAARAQLPELPDEKRARFEADYGLSSDDAKQLTASRELADFFEAAVVASGGEAKPASNWVNGEFAAALNRDERELADSPVSPAMLGGMLKRLAEGAITSKMAKEVFAGMWAGEGDADAIIEARGLKPTDSSELEGIIDDIIAANAGQVEQFRSGKEKVFGFFVGQTMKATKGQADPKVVNDLLRSKLAG